MPTAVCTNSRCQGPLEAGASFCPRCGQRTGTVLRSLQTRRRRRFFRLPLLAVFLISGWFVSMTRHASFVPMPPRPLATANDPQIPPADDAGAPAAEAPVSPPMPSGSDPLPPFDVILGPTLQRFEIVRLGWRAVPQAWGTPAVLWVDLRPVRAMDDRHMPGVLLAWCFGRQPTQIKRVTGQWGTDNAGPILHLIVDFDGLERPFSRLRLGAE